MSTATGATAPQKYFGNFTDAQSVRREFSDSHYDWDKRQEIVAEIDGFPTDAQILFATYTYEDYSGSAFVLFEREGKLFEVHGSHCSCHGLEGQWTPEETTWAAIAMRPVIIGHNDDEDKYWMRRDEESYTPEGVVALRALVKAHAA